MSRFLSPPIRLGFAVVALSLGLTAACTKSNPSSSTGTDASAKAETKSELKVGLVLDKGGKDDRSFNAAAFRGAQQAVKDFHIEMKDVESPDDAAFEPALRTFAERGYQLVIAIGFAQIDAVKKVAPQFPNTHFAIVDGVVEGANVESLMFNEHEGSYLVGYLAGLMTKTNKVGFIGGMDIALIKRFELAFTAGLKAANPKADLTVNYVGVNNTAWANPVRGKELALAQYGNGVDIIFHAAGASGLGVFDAAEEKKQFVIGCDSNQNDIKPGRVVTSMLKRVDTAVYNVIKDQVQGKFAGGQHAFGLKDGGIDYAVDANNQALIAPYKDKIDAVRKDIESGKIQVPDYYKK